VEKHLTGKATEPYELVPFKLYKNQLPLLEQALETAGLMLSSDKSRGYCLEMICADFLAGEGSLSPSPTLLHACLSRALVTGRTGGRRLRSVSSAYSPEFLDRALDPDFKFSLIQVAADAQHY
jgi:hypothetical protein